MKISIDTERKVIILDDEIELLDLLKVIENLEKIIGNGKDWKIVSEKQTFPTTPLKLPIFPLPPYPVTVDEKSTNIYPNVWRKSYYLTNT